MTPHSPDDNAGLLPYGDYIVGSPEGSVHGEAGLGELVEDYLSRSLRLWVYNHEYAVTRLVTITPSSSWGGEGALGCVLGFGALHRLPAPLAEPPEDPGETMFETAARFSNEESRRPSSTMGMLGLPPNLQSYQTTPQLPSEGFLVPANLTNAPPPMAPLKGARKAKKAVSPGRGFDDVFKEGEEKSREEDRPSGGRGEKPPPPPPAGGPPRVTVAAAEHEPVAEGEGEPGEEVLETKE